MRGQFSFALRIFPMSLTVDDFDFPLTRRLSAPAAGCCTSVPSSDLIANLPTCPNC